MVVIDVLNLYHLRAWSLAKRDREGAIFCRGGRHFPRHPRISSAIISMGVEIAS